MTTRGNFGFGAASSGGGGGPVAMAGDVTGMSNANVVEGLATFPIDLAAPADGDHWVFDGTTWIHIPQAVSFLVSDTPGTTIVSRRSANQSVTAAGLVGATNLGSDTVGVAGVTADYATLIGGDGGSATVEYSVCIGGQTNTASGANATTIGGANLAASQLGASCIGGETNTASGTYSATIGGNSNTASNTNSVCVGGSFVNATGIGSATVGGSSITVSATSSATVGGASHGVAHSHVGITGGLGATSRNAASQVHASGQTEAAGTGNRQWQRTIVRGDTPGAAPAETVNLGFSAYGAVPTTTAFTLLDDRTYSVQVALSAVRTAGTPGEGRAIVVHGFVRRTGGAVNVVAQHVVSHIGDPGCCLYDVDLIASGGTLLVQATTGAGNTHATRWVGSVEWEEVRYA